MAYLDGEYGAKIYCLAPKLEQAAIVYDNFFRMVLQEPELAQLAQKRRSDVYLETTNTSIRPLAFNAKKSDGFNPHLAVCDEIASWPAEQGLKQYEVMKSALGARKQPMILSISTAGYVNDGPYDELMMRATAVLMGASEERRLLPILYLIDDVENGTTSRSCARAIRTWASASPRTFQRGDRHRAQQPEQARRVYDQVLQHQTEQHAGMAAVCCGGCGEWRRVQSGGFPQHLLRRRYRPVPDH